MANKSLPQIRRELRGIEHQNNPLTVAAGKKRAVYAKAKKDGISNEQAIMAQKRSEIALASNLLPKGGQVALNNVLASEQRRAANLLSIQDVKKLNILNNFAEIGEKVAKRLVELALGQNSFFSAPASVQRLAMVDVLTYAGISKESAESQAKPVHEMNKEELEDFIFKTKALIEKHEINEAMLANE